MSAYLAKVIKLLDDFIGYEIIQILWINNMKADVLAQLVYSFDIWPWKIYPGGILRET